MKAETYASDLSHAVLASTSFGGTDSQFRLKRWIMIQKGNISEKKQNEEKQKRNKSERMEDNRKVRRRCNNLPESGH
ncbi:hypothetical protein HanPSC8_Chr17g0771871 [Helianthus annuus]|nr:hypothetical protein HanPSC8_Chr17g0771871 [Helianthus annuus]